jgi:MAF protein
MGYNTGVEKHTNGRTSTLAKDAARSRTLVLASGSPRRRELTAAYFAPMVQENPTVAEGRPGAGEGAEGYALRVARAKAEQAGSRWQDALVIGADTVVVLDGQVLGKPDSQAEAREMLARLRGRTHPVITSVVVMDTFSKAACSSATATEVTMRLYSDAEVAAYVASGDPLDKAGAYAVQHAGFRPAEAVTGCYLNVVGLPVCELAGLLERMGVREPMRPGWRVPAECHSCALVRRLEPSQP